MSAWGNAARRKGWLEASKIFLFVGFPIGFTILQAQPGVMGFIVRDREQTGCRLQTASTCASRRSRTVGQGRL